MKGDIEEIIEKWYENITDLLSEGLEEKIRENVRNVISELVFEKKSVSEIIAGIDGGSLKSL